jgi:hypothetical protein
MNQQNEIAYWRAENGPGDDYGFAQCMAEPYTDAEFDIDSPPASVTVASASVVNVDATASYNSASVSPKTQNLSKLEAMKAQGPSAFENLDGASARGGRVGGTG